MSNERFFRCPHCGLPHGQEESLCPVSQKPIVRAPVGSSGALSDRSMRAATPLPPRAVPAGPPAKDVSALIGAVIDGKYHVLFILGRGGMGTVYEAEQTSVGRRVAVKVLHVEEAKNSVTLKRFFQEAKVAASLPHTNICQIYDYGKLPDGSPFIVMERLEGESLAERLRWEGPMRIPVALEIACQALGALSFAHRKNVVHRDVKPENIFLAKVGKNTSVKIVDFGLSKLIVQSPTPGEETTQLTKTGIAMGTPYYMAPEQAFGERSLDGRADVWAVGVTLYECLAGKRPFAGKGNYNLMRAIAAEPHIPLGELRSPLPEGLEEVLAKALAKDRDQRHRTAGTFQRALVPILRQAAHEEKDRTSVKPVRPT